jgi:hypothetical protein
MAQCAGTKRNGERCTATVEPPQRHCWWHDPANAEERRRAASKGGRSKPSKELQAIKKRLSQLANDVLDGSVDKGDAAVVSQVLNVYLRAVGIELKVKEQLELTERLDELEAMLKQREQSA